MKILLLALAYTSIVPTAWSLSPDKWGGALTSPCLSETDPRYDEDYPTSIVGQDPRWADFEGFWKITLNFFDENGDPKGPEPRNTATGRQYPYKQDDQVGFYNHTFIGSRMIVDRIYIKYPAPMEFCQGNFTETELNVIEPGECGVTGKYSAHCSIESAFFAVSSIFMLHL
jgi:hypothetical protein